MNKHLVFSVIILMSWLLAPVHTTQAAQLPTQEQPGPVRSGEGPTDPAELETFLDQLMLEQMDEHHIAGVVVSVVKDGEILFTQGYGLADVAGNKPVNPETTLFNIGSITKIFTFTAAMQLVEQGKLDLNADVNTYLDFEIPATYPQPITMAHLMSHSAGLDEFFFGVVAPDAAEVLPLGEYLRTHLPPRVRPPGIATGYTNYGAALAGYIVERVSGQPYATYIEEHILKPLGMANTSPQALLPEALSQNMSLTYAYTDGAFLIAKDSWLFPHGTPHCSIKSTATDMARFMIAHLQDGAYQGARILTAETTRLMHSQHFTQDQRLKGWAHGFMELRMHNPRMIGHGGDSTYFHSQMVLVPEAGLGFFVANNTGADDKEMVENVLGAFIDHYFPLAVTPPTPLANSTTDLTSLEGSYASAQASYGTQEKTKLILGIQKIQAQADGSLLLSSLAGSQRYVEVEPMLFQRDDGQHVDYFDQFTFRTGPDGKIEYLLADLGAFQRLPWYETMEIGLLFSAIVLLIFLSVPIAALVWRLSPRLREQATRQPRHARQARWLLGLLVVLYFISLGGMFSAFATQEAFLFGNAIAYIVGNFLAIPVAILALGAVVFTILAWRRGYWNLTWRIHYTLVALGAVAVVWWYFNWKIIG